MWLENLVFNNYSYCAFFILMIYTNVKIYEISRKYNKNSLPLIYNMTISTNSKTSILSSLFGLICGIFGEELIFRIAYPVIFEGYFIETTIILLTSLMFSLAHLQNIILMQHYHENDIIVLLGMQCSRTFILGIYLSFFKKSMIICFLSHMVFNIFNYGFLLIYDKKTNKDIIKPVNTPISKPVPTFYELNFSAYKMHPLRRHSFASINKKDNSLNICNNTTGTKLITNKNPYYDTIMKPIPIFKNF